MGLKRVITLKEALGINIGAIIGAGIFAISGLAAGIAGPAVIIAIAIGAVIAMLTGLSFAQLASVFPKEGGDYEYARDLLGRYGGVVAGVFFIMASIIGGAVVALSFAGYFDSLFGASFSLPAVAGALIIILGVVNYFGVKHSAQFSLMLTVIKVLILAVFIVVGVFYINPSNYHPFLPNGFGSLFTASAFIFFSYTGFARVTTMGEEVKNPRKTIPKAVIYSIIISAAIYVLAMWVMVGIVPYKTISGSQAPLSLAIQYATGNPLIGYVISLGALFATINVVLSMILGMSRVTFAMSRSKDLPKAFARINRFGAPDSAIILSTVIMLAAIFSLSFTEVAALSNSTALSGYAVANITAIKLAFDRRRSSGIFPGKYFVLVPIAGTITTIGLLFFLTALSLYIMVAILVLATLYYLLLKR